MREPRADELTDRDVAHTYTVAYPSGRRFQVHGVFGLLGVPDVAVIPTIRQGDDVMALDPRAVVSRDGLLIHDPRRWTGRLGTFDAWLAEHPEWPAVAIDTVESER